MGQANALPDQRHSQEKDQEQQTKGRNEVRDSFKTDASSNCSTLNDIDEAFYSTFVPDKLLGFGASGNVLKAHHCETLESYACKYVRADGVINNPRTIKTEIEAYSRTNHVNVVRMYRVYQTERKAWMVMELVEGGDLVSALADLPVYTERSIAKLFKQILLGVQHLHENGIIHRDLKIENMLCARSASPSSSTSSPTTSETPIESVDDLTVKIVDFGLSAVLPNWVPGSDVPTKQFCGLTEMWGTTEYFAPEVYEEAYGFQADVWSLGCILYEMLTGELAFPSRDRRVSLMERVFSHQMHKPVRCFKQRSAWRKLSPEARSLIKGMLKRNHLKRLDIAGCLSHPWIKMAEEGKIMKENLILRCPTLSCRSESTDGEFVMMERDRETCESKTLISSTIHDKPLPIEVHMSYKNRAQRRMRRNAKREVS
eukprot:scaffold1302_cov165-Ochromonas_danica.AAC.2